MRSIPSALRIKLLNRFKAEDTDSKPNLRLVATQTSINTLLSEPIHEDIAPALGDVAVRQMEGDANLAFAYAICLDDGVAQIYKRRFPAGFDYKWEYQWTYGRIEDAAIEYNGVWKMNAAQEWYYLQTEEYPYIFTVEDGNLYVQHWRDRDSRALLAIGVSQISSCKGWQSSVDIDLDQGLIIGYLRDGAVFYRALCCQHDGSYVWEAEREVTTLGSGNTTLSVIRTNDFRIGFLTQNGSDMLLTLTHRNYAGMSVRPETIHINTFNARAWLPRIREYYGYTDESAGLKAELPYFMLDALQASPEIAVDRVEKINRDEGFSCYGFRVYLDKALHGVPDPAFLAGCKVSAPNVTVISSEYDSELQAIVLHTSADIRRTLEVTITIPEHRNFWYYRLQGQAWFLPSLTAVAEAEAIYHYGYENETAAIYVLGTQGWIDEAVFTWLFDEASYAIVSIPTASMTLAPVSTLPI
ncbi:MAG: hypothetical protein PHV18_00035 [Lachnospiraceae bacterium]|nr:hypothetical protein [Lachnospiraceae bacterium]